jgi:hypothetical protein
MAFIRFWVVAVIVAVVLYVLALSVQLPAASYSLVFAFAGLLVAGCVEFVLKRLAKPATPQPGPGAKADEP